MVNLESSLSRHSFFRLTSLPFHIVVTPFSDWGLNYLANVIRSRTFFTFLNLLAFQPRQKRGRHLPSPPPPHKHSRRYTKNQRLSLGFERPREDAAVRGRAQRAMEHARTQSGEPASHHTTALALAKRLRRWRSTRSAEAGGRRRRRRRRRRR